MERCFTSCVDIGCLSSQLLRLALSKYVFGDQQGRAGGKLHGACLSIRKKVAVQSVISNPSPSRAACKDYWVEFAVKRRYSVFLNRHSRLCSFSAS